MGLKVLKRLMLQHCDKVMAVDNDCHFLSVSSSVSKISRSTPPCNAAGEFLVLHLFPSFEAGILSQLFPHLCDWFLLRFLANGLLDIMYDIPSQKNVKECIVSEDEFSREKPLALYENKL